MEEIIQTLHEGHYSCVVKNQEIRTFVRRGIRDLYELLRDDPSFLRGAKVADKVVGRAAAGLMVAGGVKSVYTDLISQSALELLQDADIDVTYAQRVDVILNRDRSDWCPMERLSKSEKTANGIVTRLQQVLEKK